MRIQCRVVDVTFQMCTVMCRIGGTVLTIVESFTFDGAIYFHQAFSI